MQAAAVLLVTDPTLHKSWWGASHGGTHVKRAPHKEGGDGGLTGAALPTHAFSSSELPCDKNDRRACRSYVLDALKPVYALGEHNVRTVNGDRVMVAWSGVRHGMNDGLPTWQEAVAAMHIDDLIQNSVAEEVRPDKLGRKDPATTTVYDVASTFDGVPHSVKIFVRNHTDGNRYYDHVTVEKKTPAGLTGSAASGFPSSTPTLPYAGADSTIPKNLNKSMPSRLVVFSKELPMNQFVMLKSHIDAYTRKDGAVVGAHDDKRLGAAANTAHRAGVVANRATSHTSGNDKFKVAATKSHADAASLHQSAAGHHAKAAKMFQDAISAGEDTKQNTEAAAFHAKQAEMHGSHARTHAVMHKTNPNGVASSLS